MKGLLALGLIAAGVAAAWWFGLLHQAGLTPPSAAIESAPSPGKVYQWKDRQGRVHFGDQPPAGENVREAELAPLTVVTMPKAPPPSKTAGGGEPREAEDGGGDEPMRSPSTQLRNPVLERMGVLDAPKKPD